MLEGRRDGHALRSRFENPGQRYADTDEPKEPPSVGGVGVEDPAFPFIARSFAMLAVAGLDTDDPDLAERAVEAGRKRYAASLEEPDLPKPEYGPPPREPRQEASRVYYMRIGNRVKIGFSTNLIERVKTINPEELMAVEPGGQDVERRRHGQFCQLRTHGEWFELEEPLTSHIARLAVDSRAQVDRIEGRPTRHGKNGRVTRRDLT